VIRELSVPERLVHAAEAAIRKAAVDVASFPLGDKAYGYVHDFAKAAVAAAFKEYAGELGSRGFTYSAIEIGELAYKVCDVPALEGT
jgi:hypothetical protein